MLAAVAAFTAIAVDASAGGYIDVIHNVELTTNTKGTSITSVTWKCGNIGFATRSPLRHAVKITKAATFSASVPMTATTYAADGTGKKAAVHVTMKGYFGGIGSPANGTLRSAKCQHGKPQKFAAYPVNI
jgi:hypothetical protein